MVKTTRFRKYDIRQLIEKIDPAVRKRQTLTYEWSNGRKFYKNELPGVSAGSTPPGIDPINPYDQFITSDGGNFITSDVKNFKVLAL